MTTHTEKLKQEHRELLAVLKNAKEQCVSTQEGFDILKNAEDMLLRHLASEDNEVYPALRRAAETDEHIRKTLSFFDKDLAEVSEVANDFFSRYDKGCTDIDFIQDFGTFFVMFKERMAREENVLFPEYDRLKK
jgi:hemerythrin-like domain-containing protein